MRPSRAQASVAAAALVFAGPAFAVCPTAADVDGDGVYIDFSDGTYIHYKRLEEEVVGEVAYLPIEEENFFKARYLGFHQVIDAALDGDAPDVSTLLTFQPVAEAPAWPEIGPGVSWEGRIVTQRRNGDFVNTIEQRIEVTGQEIVHISGCNYDADVVVVEEVYPESDGASEWRYLRALGIAYIVANGDVGEDYEFAYVPRLISLDPPR